MKLSLKKAELTVGKKIIPGVLLVVKKSDDEKENIEGYCTDYIPDQLFVGLNSKPVFYSNRFSFIDEMLWGFKKVKSEYCDYISRSFLEKESGLFVNFYQPSRHYDGDPVYVTVTKKPAFVEMSVDEDE
jgi:hypothetical protein